MYDEKRERGLGAVLFSLLSVVKSAGRDVTDGKGKQITLYHKNIRISSPLTLTALEEPLSSLEAFRPLLF